MSKQILLTSFDTWLPHQTSNSSDDLLHEIAKLNVSSPSLNFLRQMPVDVELASRLVIDKINQLQPDGIICCGMAESRTDLTVESTATCGDSVLKTLVELEQLVAGSFGIKISHDAGKFVCEGLYHSVLKYLCDRQMNTPCIFVHIPIMNAKNLPKIVADLEVIIHKIGYL